jgi:tRNA 2-thiouridine synthesizing protein E
VVEGNIFDNDGFMLDISSWSEPLAKQMAEKEFSIELTELHMQIIQFIRDFYFKWEAVPMMKTIITNFRLENGQIDEMFKRGRSSSRGIICKLGGLPKMLCIASGC